MDLTRLQRALDMVAAFPQGAVVFFSIGSITTEEGPCLALYATNRDYIFEAVIPVLNTEDLYQGILPRTFIKFQTLHSLSKLYPDFVFAFDDQGQVSYHSQYVTYLLRPMVYDHAVLPEPDYSKIEPAPFPVPKVALQSAKKMLDFGVRVVDNKVLWKGNHLSGFFLVSAFDFTLQGEPAPFPVQFRKFDISLMSMMAQYGDALFGVAPDRFCLFVPEMGMALSSLAIRGTDKSSTGSVITKDQCGFVRFDLALLSKAISFVRASSQDSTVYFSKHDSGAIRVRLDSTSLFYVGTGELPNYGFLLRLDELRKILGVIPDGTRTVDCKVYGDGARFVMEDAGCTYEYSIGKFDTTQTRAVNDEVIDRLATKPKAIA